MNLFTEGQKITLIFQKDSNLVEMTCSVEKVLDDRLHLILPQYFMRYIDFLQVGFKLTAKAFSKFGTLDFNSVVITSPLEETFSIELDYNSVRLTSGDQIPVSKAVEPITINFNNTTYKCKTFELSTEYVKFSSDNKFAINDILECSLLLPKDYGIINFKATVFEIDPIYDNEYTVSYLTITEQDKQTLLYYMYMYEKDTD